MLPPLIAGTIFFTVGIVSCFFYRWKKIKAYVPLIIGASLIIISTIGPLSKAKAELAIAKVKNITRGKIASIILQPTERIGRENIVHQNIIIVDAAIIEQICTALNKAELGDENYMKNADSACSMKFNLKNNSNFSIAIQKKGQATRVDINSSGEAGWHYAVLAANELGVIVERLAK